MLLCSYIIISITYRQRALIYALHTTIKNTWTRLEVLNQGKQFQSRHCA